MISCGYTLLILCLLQHLIQAPKVKLVCCGITVVHIRLGETVATQSPQTLVRDIYLNTCNFLVEEIGQPVMDHLISIIECCIRNLITTEGAVLGEIVSRCNPLAIQTTLIEILRVQINPICVAKVFGLVQSILAVLRPDDNISGGYLLTFTMKGLNDSAESS